jgi:succinyl-diaminopimelate desuccinylase
MKKLLKNLIGADSTVQKGELAAANVILKEFYNAGIDCLIDKWNENRANLVAQAGPAGRKTILFAAHLDVVGPGEEKWKFPPFSAVEKNGRIFGRGATDMKGAIAAAVTAVCQVVKSRTKLKGRIIFSALAGEETDSCGASKFTAHLKVPKNTGVIITEPTDFEVVTAHRGLLWLQISTKGKAAHGSTPHLGINAINSMRLLLNELDRFKIKSHPHKLLGNCSMSINTIAGGKTINVVPDTCSIGLDIRTLPKQNHQQIVKDFKKVFAKLKRKNPKFDAEVSLIRDVTALETDNRCEFVRDFCLAVGTDEAKAVGFTTDGPYFAALGLPVVIFGPGKPHLCHKPNEYIEITDLEKAVEYYKKIILSLLT